MKAENSPPRRRRWRFQFGLGGLLALTTVIAIWLSIQVEQAKNEKAALASFQQSNAMIRFAYQRAGVENWDGKIEPPPKGWLGNYLGDEYFYRIDMVAFLESKVTTKQIRLLSELSAIESLSLQGQSHLGDQDLSHVCRIGSLRTLCLWDTQVSDDGIEQLKNLTTLKMLGLSRTKITDASVDSLAKLKQLELLELDGTRVTKAGVERLRAELPACELRHDHVETSRQ